MKWYRLAADQGDAGAQNNLGTMYSKGQGVPPNDNEAAKWFQLSANQGNAVAQKNLAALLNATSSLPTEPAAAPPTSTLSESHGAAYRQGQADRQSWEAWFGSQTDDYRVGADYWASQRSLPRPGSCSAVPPSTGADWTAGCFAAQQKLAAVDVRRKTEPEYRLGWNNAPPVASAPKNSRETLGAASPPPSASTDFRWALAVIEPGAEHPLPPGLKLHTDPRSLCEQISDDFIVEAAAGGIEDNNPAPRDRPPQRDANGGFVKFFLKGVIDHIDRATFVNGAIY